MRRSAIAVVLALLVAGTKADRALVVDSQDPRIQYITAQNGDLGASWTVVQAAPIVCSTPQILTSRLGDSMIFTFNGTGIQVVGTIGTKGGIINFALDGVNTTFDRTKSTLVCDYVLFQMTGLPDVPHTIVATLVGRAPRLSSGIDDGSLSIQRIRYFIPSVKESNVGAMAGGIVAGIHAASIGVGFLWWFFRRRLRRLGRAVRSGSNTEGRVSGPTGRSAATSPDIVTTPLFRSSSGSKNSRTDGPSS